MAVLRLIPCRRQAQPGSRSRIDRQGQVADLTDAERPDEEDAV
jgi:hypothetical protein